jgi:hypothetical protein
MATKKKSTVSAASSAIADVFGSATIAAPDKPKKGKGKDRLQVEMEEPFDTFVALTLVEKAIEGVKDQLGEQFKNEAFDVFMGQIMENGKQPDSFDGVCNDAQAAFQFKQRGQGFAKDIADRLAAANCPVDRTDKVPERFVINPEVLANQELLGKLAVALKSIKDFSGIDIIQKQEPVYTYKFTEATIAAVKENVKDPTERAELLRAISTIAVAQAKLAGGDAKSESALTAALQHLASKGILNIGSKGKK